MQRHPEKQDPPFRIMIVEDHTLVREGLVSLLRTEGDFQIVAEAGDGQQAIQLSGTVQPDMLLMDLSLPNINGTEAITEIKRRHPNIQVIVLTLHRSEEYIRAALRAGSSGYVLKDDSSEELLAALHSVAKGKIYLSPSICKNIIAEFIKGKEDEKISPSWVQLSHREREVLKLVAEGRHNRDIAEYLSLSEKTVEKHRSSLMKKLSLHSTAQITAYAIHNGLITLA